MTNEELRIQAEAYGFSMQEFELRIQAEVLRLFTTTGKVPHFDEAHPMFKAAVEKYAQELKAKMDEFELNEIDFDEVERRNDEKLANQEEIPDESDCDGCKI